MVLVQEFRMEKKTGAFEDNSFKRTSHVNSCRTAGDWLLKIDFTRSEHIKVSSLLTNTPIFLSTYSLEASLISLSQGHTCCFSL